MSFVKKKLIFILFWFFFSSIYFFFFAKVSSIYFFSVEIDTGEVFTEGARRGSRKRERVGGAVRNSPIKR